MRNVPGDREIVTHSFAEWAVVISTGRRRQSFAQVNRWFKITTECPQVIRWDRNTTGYLPPQGYEHECFVRSNSSS
ncbi:hypothetical protein ECOPMV1_02898 [Escherichia coli PMV-1]|nr:hypothetical protein ECOPMV1_02898 [Escherichia coli PMV-1]